MIKRSNAAIIFCITCMSINSYAQKTIKPDLSNASRFQLVNREISITQNDNKKNVVHLNGVPNAGIAWINNLEFEKGVIEFDAKGKNVMQQSFLGIAFHGINDTSYDAVYFRPFNFQSSDAVRKSHSVQYISLPQFDWPLLREKYPGKYENGLTDDINADSWFHAKIIVDADKIEVFVNNKPQASLTVKPLNNYTTGKIGFWVGNNSDGDFANLEIKQ
jgi:hypothetical protein